MGRAKRYICVLMIITILMCSGCIELNWDYESPQDIQYQVTEQLMNALENKNVEEVKGLLCDRFTEKCGDLDEKIQGIWEFIDGDIVSYEFHAAACGGSTTPEEGWVKRFAWPKIKRIQTSTGKSYRISYTYYFVYNDEPDLVGISYIHVLEVDEEDNAIKDNREKIEYIMDARSN